MKRNILMTTALAGLLAMAAVAVSQEAATVAPAEPSATLESVEPATVVDPTQAPATRRPRPETFLDGTAAAAPASSATEGFRPRATTTPRVSAFTTNSGREPWSPYRATAGSSAVDEHERRVQQLVRDWKAAISDNVRSAAEDNLRKALAEAFAARIAEHEQQVEELEARVKELRAQLDRRREKQDDIIEFRFQELLREAQGLGWGGGEPVGAASNPFTRMENTPLTLPGPAQVPPARSR